MTSSRTMLWATNATMAPRAWMVIESTPASARKDSLVTFHVIFALVLNPCMYAFHLSIKVLI